MKRLKCTNSRLKDTDKGGSSLNEKDVEEIERVLSSLDGVKKARVIVDETNGEMREIHVLSSGEKNSKQIVRDVETAVLTISGQRIDRRIISVAQMSAEPLIHSEDAVFYKSDNAKEGTFEIESVGFSEDGMEIEVSVEIFDGKKLTQSSKKGVKSFKSVLKLAAETTIDAIESLSGTKLRISLDDVREVSTGERKFFLGVMTVFKSNGLSKELVFAGAVGFNAVRNVAEAVVNEVNTMFMNF